jgi:type II secretory pathway component PulK
MTRRQRRSSPRAVMPRHMRGYILVMALAALTVLALVGASFGSRMDGERARVSSFMREVSAERSMQSAFALANYWLSTAGINANGVGDGLAAQWVADGRWYRLSPDVWASLQDERGLLSVNQPSAKQFRQLLLNEGMAAEKVDRLIDVLADYIDTDDLRRLNGAERPQYLEAGLLGPRNDMLRSSGELCQLPAWLDVIELCERLLPVLSTRVSPLWNPNTAPRKVLAALVPGAAPEQLQLFETLRVTAPFADGAAATARTGLSLDADSFMFHSGDEYRLTLWVQGQPRAREYNLRVLPGGLQAPWQVIRSRAVPKPTAVNLSGPAFEPLYFSLSASSDNK